MVQINKVYTPFDVLEWAKHDFCNDGNTHKTIQIKTETKDRIHFYIYTEVNRYNIVAIGDDKSYLGCQVLSRKPRAGETHQRGRDLPDGDITPETWNKILLAIIRNELVQLSRQVYHIDIDIKEDKVENVVKH